MNNGSLKPRFHFIVLILTAFISASYFFYLSTRTKQLTFIGGTHDIYIVNADGNNLENLTKSSSVYEFNPAWSPDGKMLAFSTHNQIKIMALDDPKQKTLAYEVSESVNELAWSPDGKLIAFSIGKSANTQEYSGPKIQFIDSDSGNIIEPEREIRGSMLTWAQDSTKIAFVSMVGIRTDKADIFTYSLVDSEIFRITGDSLPLVELNIFPIWLADNKHIAFINCSSTDIMNYAGIYTIEPDGSNLMPVIKAAVGIPCYKITASMDGKQIAFWGGNGIYTVNVDGTNLRQITSRTDGVPVWSPDGTQLAFVSERDGKRALYVVNISSRDVTQISDSVADDSGLSWRPTP